MTRHLAILCALAACGGRSPVPETPSPSAAPEPARASGRLPEPVAEDQFLIDHARTDGFRLGRPRSVTVTPSGDAVLFLRSGPRSLEASLYQHDVATGEETRIAAAADLLGGDDGELSAEEKARRERQRLSAGGIVHYQLSRDGGSVLIPLKGRLFLLDRASGEVRELPSGGYAIDPRLSPDGDRVASVQGGDLVVESTAGGGERTLIGSDDDAVSFGAAEFVAQEEMQRYHGYWWSPDGEHIAFQRTDTSDVETLYIADPQRPEAAPNAVRYPRAGTDNADVRLGVIPVGGGDPVWIEWDREKYPYLVDVVWSEGGPLTVVVEDRRQKQMRVLAANPETGATDTLLVETDDAWLNVEQPDASWLGAELAMPRWLPDGSGFLWTTARRGARQLELRDADGELVRALTPAEPWFQLLLDVDANAGVAYVLASDDPTERHVARVALDGSADPEMITETPGRHEIAFAARADVAVHESHGVDGSVRQRVLRGGEKVGELRSRAEEPPYLPEAEWTTVQVDGRAHHAVVVRPRNFDESLSYPVIVEVYGGPLHQEVVADPRTYLRSQWLADHGFIVVSIDGRGSPGRGRAWERAIRGDFASVPLADQVGGLEALAARYPELDTSRVGIFGWSFGGYLSAVAVMRRPDVFHAGVAGAPVTDWRDYDTHYTERYLGLPSEHPDAYERSSAIATAEDLERPLLLIHGTVDDNVLFTHSIKMSDALFHAGVPHDFLPMSGLTHMVSSPEAELHQAERIADFFVDHLADRPAPGARTGR